MTNELSAALRQLADRIEAGELLPRADQAALVLADPAGNVQATYMGRLQPEAHARAGIGLLSAGIAKFNQGDMQEPAVVTPARPGSIFGSTH